MWEGFPPAHGFEQQGCVAGLGHVALAQTWSDIPVTPEFFRPHVGYGGSVFHLGDSLTLASLETDSKMGNCPWRVYLGGSSQEVYLEGSKRCSTGWVEKLAWNMVTSELSQTGVRELLVRLGSLNIQSLASVHLTL